MQLAHKIRLDPNNKQETYFKKASGIARFAYNWGLAKWNEQYKEGKKASGKQLKKEFNKIKKEQFPWCFEVTKYAAQQPFIHLDNAYKKFFNKQASAPVYKKKGKTVESFYIGGDQVNVENNKLIIPKLGGVRLCETLRFSGKINSVTISQTAGNWFASIQIDSTGLKSEENLSEENLKIIEEKEAKKIKIEKRESVGVDLGINKTCTLTNNLAINMPHSLTRNSRRLKKLQRQLSKMKKGSKRYIKQKNRIAKLHHIIACQRSDTTHKITTFIARNFHHIGVENLNVSGMLKNHKLARKLSDVNFGEFLRQLKYKIEMEKGTIKIHDRFFPSTKTCSNPDCKKIKNDLTLSDRVYRCNYCNLEIDRDLNAAKNLDPIPGVPRKFTPVEITAIQCSGYPAFVTSIE